MKSSVFFLFLCFCSVSVSAAGGVTSILKTVDKGKTWKLALSFDGYQADRITREKDIVRVIAKDKVYSSASFGAEWKQDK